MAHQEDVFDTRHILLGSIDTNPFYPFYIQCFPKSQDIAYFR